MNTLNNINFSDKEKNYIKVDSKYVLATNEINEIKNVVNSLILTAQTYVCNFSNCAKFLIIKISQNIFKNLDDYVITLTLSSKEDFSDITFLTSLYDNFFKFENGNFKKIKTISKNDGNVQIFVDLNNAKIEEPIDGINSKKYFIKYALVDKTHFNNINEINYGSTIGSYGLLFQKLMLDDKKIQYNKSNFLNELNDLNIEYEYENNSYIFNIIAEYKNGYSENISNKKFNMFSLDEGNEKLHLLRNVLSIDIIDKRKFKILAIDYIDNDGKRIIKPFILNLSNTKSFNYKDTIPSILYFNRPYDYKIFSINENGNEIDKTNLIDLKVENILKIENKIISNNVFENGSYGYLNYENNEKLSKITSMRLIDVILKDKNGNEITYIDQDKTYEVNVFALFKEDEKEIKEIKINDFKLKTKISTCIEILGSSIRNKNPKNDLNDTINIEFYLNNELYKFDKTLFVKGTNLINIEIEGEAEFLFSSSGEYTTNAFYNNNTKLNVISEYVVKSLNPKYHIKYAYDSLKNKMIIKGDRCVFDKEVQISALFKEPGFEKYEFDDCVRTLTIIGDNISYLDGTIILVDENLNRYDVKFDGYFRNPKRPDTTTITTNAIINLNIEKNKWVIGFKDINIKNKYMNLINIKPVFLGTTKEYEKDVIFNENIQSWIMSNAVPEKAASLKDLIITFNFDPGELL